MSEEFKGNSLYAELYNRREKNSNRWFWGILIAIFLLIIGLRAYWVNTFSGVVVSGPSMEQTLQDKMQLLLKSTPEGKGAKRGDVIVVYVADYPEVQAYNQIHYPNGQGKVEFIIKRLIAVEGDTVKCQDGNLYIKYKGESDFVLLDEPYAYYHKDGYTEEEAKNSYDFGVYEIPEGKVFFLGDNRCVSMDSRYNEPHGSHLSTLYKRTDIIGVVPQWAIDNRVILEKIFF